jgi:hypothetical protein
LDTLKRSAWKAWALGSAIATIAWLIPVTALFWDTRVPSGYAGAAVGSALGLVLLSVPIAAQAGGVAGVLLLRKRQSVLYALWVIPCFVFSAALLIYLGIGAYRGIEDRVQAYKQNADDEKRQSQLILNYSNKVVGFVTMDWDDSSTSRYYTYDEFPPLEGDTPATAAVTRDAPYTPEWQPGRAVKVSWRRPSRGATFEPEEIDSMTAGVRVQASVVPPRYTGTKNKIMLLFFLPEDRVRIEMTDRDQLDARVSRANDGSNVAQGVAEQPARK